MAKEDQPDQPGASEQSAGKRKSETPPPEDTASPAPQEKRSRPSHQDVSPAQPPSDKQEKCHVCETTPPARGKGVPRLKKCDTCGMLVCPRYEVEEANCILKCYACGKTQCMKCADKTKLDSDDDGGLMVCALCQTCYCKMCEGAEEPQFTEFGECDNCTDW